MEKKNIHRNLLAILAIVSFIAFISVNIHANRLKAANGVGNTEQLVQPKMENGSDENIDLPGASIITRTISIAQRLLSLSK